MNNRLYNTETNKKLAGVFYSGLGLIAFALTNLFLLVTDKLMPMLEGTFMAEMFPGVDATAERGIFAIFGTVFGVIAVSYVAMVFLGMNAIRLSKNPEGVKTHTGIATALVFTGIVSLICVATSFEEGSTLMDNFHSVIFSIAHISFAISYIFETRTVKKEMAALYA